MTTNKDRDTKWVQKLDRHFLECRSMRHMWDQVGFEIVPNDEISIRVDRGSQILARTLQCRRCFTGKMDYYVRQNQINLKGFYRHSSRYLYPKGYTFVRKEHEFDTPKQQDYVIEQFRRARVI